MRGELQIWNTADVHACASGVASKLAENINRLLSPLPPPKYQHFENSAYLAEYIKYKEKKYSCQIFQVGKVGRFFSPFKIKNVIENVINFTSSNQATLFSPNYFYPRLSDILRIYLVWSFKGVAP